MLSPSWLPDSAEQSSLLRTPSSFISDPQRWSQQPWTETMSRNKSLKHRFLSQVFHVLNTAGSHRSDTFHPGQVVVELREAASPKETQLYHQLLWLSSLCYLQQKPKSLVFGIYLCTACMLSPSSQWKLPSLSKPESKITLRVSKQKVFLSNMNIKLFTANFYMEHFREEKESLHWPEKCLSALDKFKRWVK